MYRTFLYSAAIVLVINGAPDRAAGATIQVLGQTAPVAAVPGFADRFYDMPSGGHPATHGTPVVAPGARVRVTAPPIAPEPLVGTVLRLDDVTIFSGLASRQRYEEIVAALDELLNGRRESKDDVTFKFKFNLAGLWDAWVCR